MCSQYSQWDWTSLEIKSDNDMLKKVVKLIYDSFISSTDSFPEKTYQKWKTILRITISQDNFLEYFAAMYSCTTATKLIEFQYKILHSTLITNEKLSECKNATWRQWRLRLRTGAREYYILGELPKWVFVVSYFGRLRQHTSSDKLFCQELGEGFASPMQRCHLISSAKFAGDW